MSQETEVEEGVVHLIDSFMIPNSDSILTKKNPKKLFLNKFQKLQNSIFI